jgi:hypothetical protein
MDHFHRNLDCRFTRDEDDASPVPLFYAGEVIAAKSVARHVPQAAHLEKLLKRLAPLNNLLIMTQHDLQSQTY